MKDLVGVKAVRRQLAFNYHWLLLLLLLLQLPEITMHVLESVFRVRFWLTRSRWTARSRSTVRSRSTSRSRSTVRSRSISKSRQHRSISRCPTSASRCSQIFQISDWKFKKEREKKKVNLQCIHWHRLSKTPRTLSTLNVVLLFAFFGRSSEFKVMEWPAFIYF